MRLLVVIPLLLSAPAAAQTRPQTEAAGWGALLSPGGNVEGTFEIFPYPEARIDFPVSFRLLPVSGHVIEAFPVAKDEARERVIFDAYEYAVPGPPLETPRSMWREVATGRLELGTPDEEGNFLPIEWVKEFVGPRDALRQRLDPPEITHWTLSNKSRGATPGSGVSESRLLARGIDGRYFVKGIANGDAVLVLRQRGAEGVGELRFADGSRLRLTGTVQAARFRGNWTSDDDDGTFDLSVESSGFVSGSVGGLYERNWFRGERDP